ncbi:hypothetical protein QAD02_022857 [Eretmocerus hayati]|uniref:Uncharacterized protein n=1 Tax=Eretmocerus hayati TaxID=131215 RepID=A0ACC2PVC0_9HYME|nr:hypothetical protein QAD02_022857 [Eretmocerus hayati]
MKSNEILNASNTTVETNDCANSIGKKPKTSELSSNLGELVALMGLSKQCASHGLELTGPNESNVNDILDGLTDLNLGEKDERNLLLLTNKKRARVPDPGQKNTFLAQNVAHFGTSYIDYCIIPGEKYIYKESSEKINSVNLAIGLTFPYSESARCCLACPGTFPADQQSLFEHVQNSEHKESLQAMLTNDELFKNYPDQFSDLRLAQLYMQEDESDTNWIYCYPCDVKIKNEDSKIYMHLELLDHNKKSQNWKQESNILIGKFSGILKDMWYYAQWFTCVICKKKFDLEIEFASHLKSKKHLKLIKRINQENISVNFDMCHICSLFWYGKSDDHDKHCDDYFHKWCVKTGNFNVPEMSRGTVNFLQDSQVAANNLVEESDKVRLENNKDREVLQAIEETVKCRYPRAKAHAFGSRISYLANNCDTDLDVFLDCEDVYKNSATLKKSQQYLVLIQKLFENDVNRWIIDDILLSTRVPIMKLRYIPTNIKCDISCINGLSVEKSKLLGYYCKAYPFCRKLILYLKKWLSFCHLSGSDCITTFAISWLVIFYLQVKDVIPDVYYLINNRPESNVVDGWECGFLTDLPVDYPIDIAFNDHLQGFFKYYGTFDYQKLVICPLMGEVITKKTFAHSEQLPDEMRSYKSRLADDKSIIFRIDSPMCLQDPIDLSQNISKAVKKYHLRCFRQYCLESLTILSSLSAE